MQPLNSLRQTLKQQNQRQMVVISGSQSWQQKHIQDLFTSSEKVFWITGKQKQTESSEQVPLCFKYCGFEAIESKRLRYYLGQEVDGAIIDVKEGLSADSLGIVAGMISGGGLLIILTPDIKEWLNLNNPEDARFLSTPFTLHQAYKHFTCHLINCWQQGKVVWLEEHNLNPVKTRLTPPKPEPLQSASKQTSLTTPDQLKAIEKIKSVAFGHRKRPLVITADRGRGKTSALGLAAIECLLEGKQHIVISASRPDQVKTAFKMAYEALLELPQELQIKLETYKATLLDFYFKGELKTIEYQAPDQLILNPTSADILLVDEAAHLPTPLLIELLKRHHRMIFSTTFHGYEGSGRGFELRFKKHLMQTTPNWKSHEMHAPIRWAENDPLEALIFDTLLLNAQMAQLDSDISVGFDAAQLQYQTITSEQLIANPAEMKKLFALLVQAHYQTSPNDLQQILNSPNIQLVTAKLSHQTTSEIVGVALVIHEGKINLNKQRAHGHLVPQLLTRHYAQEDFLMLSTLRVMRIAVHPSLQRHSIGLNLIKQVEKLGLKQRVDYISSSFGGSDELLPFWFKLNFWPLHVGAKRDKASGSHNIVVAKPVSAMSRQALSLIQTRFQEQFPHLLLESLPYLSAIQVLQIVQTFRFKKNNYGLNKALSNYQNGERPYESISCKLWEWSLQSSRTIQQASVVNQAIWCDKVLKRNDWQQVAHKYHLAGRKGVEKELKAMIEQWINHKHQPTKTRPNNSISRHYI